MIIRHGCGTADGQPVWPGYQAGLAMIEVLVAVLILAIGLLGMASLQTSGLKMTTGALSRSQAVLLADDLIERARANRWNVAQYVVGRGNPPDCDRTHGFANLDIASEDVAAWRNSVSCLLPAGDAEVVVIGHVLKVTVTWDARSDDAADGRIQVEAEI